MCVLFLPIRNSSLWHGSLYVYCSIHCHKCCITSNVLCLLRFFRIHRLSVGLVSFTTLYATSDPINAFQFFLLLVPYTQFMSLCKEVPVSLPEEVKSINNRMSHAMIMVKLKMMKKTCRTQIRPCCNSMLIVMDTLRNTMIPSSLKSSKKQARLPRCLSDSS